MSYVVFLFWAVQVRLVCLARVEFIFYFGWLFVFSFSSFSIWILFFFFFFSSRRRHTRCREVSWARRCVQETGSDEVWIGVKDQTNLEIAGSLRNIFRLSLIHISEPTRPLYISYAVFCLKKKKKKIKSKSKMRKKKTQTTNQSRR
eukprot:TRINITY_DN9458_c0_g1_i1.p3 TRINITY_DN9458_c0_g1~~TRINITY_DN9458_c0_g1_i1.p3  ORF type:complete len:146 (-),score=47.27 TRINITY_DN9458_c0_g1_i1:69-506(-)